MEHIGTKRLETDRLILRRFVMEDAGPMFRNWASDPEVTRYLTWPPHQSPSLTQKVIDSWIKRYGDPAYYHWTIQLKSLGEPIGSISGVKVDEAAASVEIGYCIGRPWWGQGLVAEALSALLAFFFDQVGMARVEACHDPRNPNSGRVMQKCGMTYMGNRPKEYSERDLCWYAITREEYLAQKENQ